MLCTGGTTQAAPSVTFSFGVPPSAAASQAASPPIAIPSLATANALPDGGGSSSLVRQPGIALLHPHAASCR